MHNSEKTGRIIASVIAVVIVFIALLFVMDIIFYPCTYLRNDIHTVSSSDRDVIILGTSNGKMGIEPDILLDGTGLSGHNLCAGSEYPVDSYYMMKLIIEKQSPEMLIYELDPAYFLREKEPGNNYLLFIHEFPLSFSMLHYGAAILKDCDFRSIMYPLYEYPLSTELELAGKNISKKVTADYSVKDIKNSIQEYHENGFMEKFPVDEENFPVYTADEFRPEDIIPDNMLYLNKLMELCREKDIEFIAVSMPLPEYTINANRRSYEAAWDYFGDVFSENNITFYNFNTELYDMYSHDEVHFVDYDGHLNGDSAREFSAVLGKILNAE